MKKFLQILILAAIAGAIWYLEAGRIHPTSLVNNGTPLSNVVQQGASSTDGSGLNAVIAGDKSKNYQSAVEIADPTGFINTSNLKLADLVGKKVVLLDFWTYSCINCIRTLPYLTAWYQK